MSILEDKVSLSSIEPKSIITSNNIGEEIIKSSETGLVNSIIDSNLALVPKLIINDYTKGEKVLTEIINGLNKCKEFFISVAFITYSGLLPLLETLEKLNKNGIKGKILTTNYLNFSEPKALKKLLSFSNIQVKMYSKENFHTKGYIFKNKNHYKVIVGSSNLTQTALTKNKEWNLKISSLKEGALTKEIISEFNNLWIDAQDLTLSWLEIYEDIYIKQREYTRKTKETDIYLSFDLDGRGDAKVDTGIGFFDHMLDGFARHGLFDLNVKVTGDLVVDCHHTIEDTGIVLGNAIKKAVGDKKGIKRFGSCMLPMDETLVLCAVDLSGRPYLSFDAEFTTDRVGYMDTEMVKEFFYAISYSAGMNLHLKVITGGNNHHMIEAMFKAFAKALDEATIIDPRIIDILSTKGSL